MNAQTECMREYMRALKSADDAQAGSVQFSPSMVVAGELCEARGWAMWGGKKALGERIMFLTTKGLRAMKRLGWI